jgi:hypothetical protein
MGEWTDLVLIITCYMLADGCAANWVVLAADGGGERPAAGRWPGGIRCLTNVCWHSFAVGRAVFRAKGGSRGRNPSLNRSDWPGIYAG